MDQLINTLLRTQEEFTKLIQDIFSDDAGYLYDVITSIMDDSPLFEKINLSILNLNVILNDGDYSNSFSVQFDHRGFLFCRDNDKMRIISQKDVYCLINRTFSYHYSYMMSFVEKNDNDVDSFKSELAQRIEDSYRISDFSYKIRSSVDIHIQPN